MVDYYEKQKAEEFIQRRREQIIETMVLLGIKLFTQVIDRLGVDMTHQERYEAFDRIYGKGMREKNYEHNSNIRRS